MFFWDDFGGWILLPYLDVKETSSTVDSNDSTAFFEGLILIPKASNNVINLIQQKSNLKVDKCI